MAKEGGAMKLGIVVTALSVIGLTLPSNATSAIPSDWTVSLRRAGPLRFGLKGVCSQAHDGVLLGRTLKISFLDEL